MLGRAALPVTWVGAATITALVLGFGYAVLAVFSHEFTIRAVAREESARKHAIEAALISLEDHVVNRVTVLDDHTADPILIHALMNPGDQSESTLSDWLARIQLLGTRYKIRLLDFEGRWVDGTDPETRHRKRPWASALVDGRMSSFTGIVDLDRKPVLELALPVSYQGSAEGILSVDIPLSDLEELLLHGGAIPNTHVALVHDGTVLAESGQRSDGPRYTAASPIASLELVVTAQPINNAELRNEILADVAWIVVVMALSVIAIGILLIFRFITAPLTRIANGLRVDQPAGLEGLVVGWGVPKEPRAIAAKLDELSTEVRDREALLLQANAQLERRVSERTEHLRAAEQDARSARDAAEAASLAKSDFLATMSHEIRTPMNAVVGMTELLQNTELTAEQDEYVSAVSSSTDALLAIINDILDFSKIEAGKLDLEMIDCDIARILDELLDMFALRAEEKGIELIAQMDPACPSLVRADPVRIRQVLINLVGNALKFTSEGSVVFRCAGSTPGANPNLIRFEVEDTGIGISPEGQTRLFRSFSQVETSDARRFGGTGLGLAICRRLSEMMGGEIAVSSAEGRGSTFWFTIAVESAAQNPAREDLSEHTVAIVEANTDHREALRQQLVARGCHVESFAAPPDRLPSCDLAVLGPGSVSQAESLAFAQPATRIALWAPAKHCSSQNWPDDIAHLSRPLRHGSLDHELRRAFGLEPLAAGAKGGSAPANAAHVRGARVLVVDDNPLNLRLASKMLEALECQADCVQSGAAALSSVAGASYDLVLMDCQMPEMDGFEATRRIRQEHAALPIVALTANAMSGDRERCLDAGMNDFLPKPFKRHQLEEMLSTVLGSP